MNEVTIFKNVFTPQPFYISVEKAIDRIRTGKSKIQVEEIRKQLDEERRKQMKVNLPTVFFSGKFDGTKNENIKEYNNLIVLDFDKIPDDLQLAKDTLCSDPYIYACWISPSGNGLKAIVRIADGKQHEAHFEALQEYFPNLDKSGKNIARHCFESYDPEIFVNEKSKVFAKTKKHETIKQEVKVETGSKVFENLLRWLSNKNDAFREGERNVFIFKLASACCRYGINEDETLSLCKLSFQINNDFSEKEMSRVVRSAYRSGSSTFGTAEFTNEQLVDKIKRTEIVVKELDPDIYKEDVKPKDVIFGEDVKELALNLYRNGLEQVKGVGVKELDELFKMKRCEISLLSGIGNYGKSTFLRWYLCVRVLVHKEKFAIFAPEDNPAEEFYHDMVEIILGGNCYGNNPHRPSEETYLEVYDMISKHIFYVYPKEIAPTPEYIKERFLELIIKEKIDGCIIDPFNQLTNDYGARSDKYLETFLSECSRFAQINNVYFIIVAHPRLMKKDADGNYPCPDVYDIADGAMWNNKMDNILIYHRPAHQLDPNSPMCEIYTKKIRRQKTVGKKGFVTFEMDRWTRRYSFNGIDIIRELTGKTANEITPINPDLWMEKQEEAPF